MNYTTSAKAFISLFPAHEFRCVKETLEVAEDTSWLSRDTGDFVSRLEVFLLIFRDHLEKVKPELSQCQSHLRLVQPTKA